MRALSTRPTPSPSSSSNSGGGGDDEWNDAWESAWLPDHLTPNQRAPWETDVHFPDSSQPAPTIVLPSDADPDTKAFVEEMDERWNERRMAAAKKGSDQKQQKQSSGERRRDVDEDYRLRKQRIHAGLWMKEIERMEESRLGEDHEGGGAARGDIDRLLDSCDEIFNSGHSNLTDTKIPGSSEFKTKPDGWETTSKTLDGNIWEVTQREEDILLQEFERRIAFSKFQIASFIKTHIFSRRRPIDGWKYMIEELGPNARKGKGSVQRLPALSDLATQPFKEEKMAIESNFPSFKGR